MNPHGDTVRALGLDHLIRLTGLTAEASRRAPVTTADTATADTTTADPDDAARTEALGERVFNAVIESLEVALIHLGAKLGLYRALADGGPAYVPKYAVETPVVLHPQEEMDIPANKITHLDAYFRLRQPARILSVSPHMHLRGAGQTLQALFSEDDAVTRDGRRLVHGPRGRQLRRGAHDRPRAQCRRRL